MQCIYAQYAKVRNDVIYKNIVRDFRKYYHDEFNAATSFIKKKRYKSNKFFVTCI